MVNKFIATRKHFLFILFMIYLNETHLGFWFLINFLAFFLSNHSQIFANFIRFYFGKIKSWPISWDVRETNPKKKSAFVTSVSRLLFNTKDILSFILAPTAQTNCGSCFCCWYKNIKALKPETSSVLHVFCVTLLNLLFVIFISDWYYRGPGHRLNPFRSTRGWQHGHYSSIYGPFHL